LCAHLQANASEKKRSTTAVTTLQLYKQIVIGLYVSQADDMLMNAQEQRSACVSHVE
jgi:hypothetical protein